MKVHNVKPTAYPGTQAVLRAVGLLKSFTAARPEKGLAELSRERGLNKTTTFRLLSALESEGMVERTAGGGYRLGSEVVALGGLALGAADLRTASRPELEALARDTRETATLEILSGADVVILEEATGDHVIGSNASLGTRWPAHATSTGKVLLGFAEGGGAVAAGALPALTPRTITEPRAWARELERVREQGFAVSAEELEPGYVAVAAPVRGAHGEVVAALSVGGPRPRLAPAVVAEVAAKLQAAARRMSGRLGYRGSVEKVKAS